MKRTEVITVQWKTVPYIYNTTCMDHIQQLSTTACNSWLHTGSCHLIIL